MADEEEWGNKPKLQPVYPKDPDLHNLLDEFGNKRQPTRASRRMKFLGLEENTPSLGSGGGHEVFTHGIESYDLATGPQAPKTIRPSEDEWASGTMTDLQSDTVTRLSKARKKMNPNQKSLTKKRGRPKKS